jgi:hypothetical protein
MLIDSTRRSKRSLKSDEHHLSDSVICQFYALASCRNIVKRDCSDDFISMNNVTRGFAQRDCGAFHRDSTPNSHKCSCHHHQTCLREDFSGQQGWHGSSDHLIQLINSRNSIVSRRLLRLSRDKWRWIARFAPNAVGSTMHAS